MSEMREGTPHEMEAKAVLMVNSNFLCSFLCQTFRAPVVSSQNAKSFFFLLSNAGYFQEQPRGVDSSQAPANVFWVWTPMYVPWIVFKFSARLGCDFSLSLTMSKLFDGISLEARWLSGIYGVSFALYKPGFGSYLHHFFDLWTGPWSVHCRSSTAFRSSMGDLYAGRAVDQTVFSVLSDERRLDPAATSKVFFKLWGKQKRKGKREEEEGGRGRSEGRRKWENVERNRGGKEVGGEGTEKMKRWGRGRGKWWDTMGPRRGREGERKWKWTGAGGWWWDEKKQEDEQRDISFENYYYYFLLYFVCWCCPVSAQIWLIK